MNINQLLDLTISRDASDLHLSVDYPPFLRINGELIVIPGSEVLTAEDMDHLVFPLLTNMQKNIYQQSIEVDFSFEYQGKGRFRVNVFSQRGFPAASFRLIPFEIPPLETLGLPEVFTRMADLRQGFILVTGPTGHGKSTTLASFINMINMKRATHIITVEDPIEYVYPKGKSLIEQREMYRDSRSWGNSLRAALREDPDVLLVGELRDLETIASAMTIAETGHLVLGTLHTNSSAQSIDRIIDVFPQIQQPQIRLQLAATLEAVLSLRLIPTIEPGRVLASEMLIATPAIRNIIREGKTHLIDNAIETSAELGMQMIEKSLADLVKRGKISSEVAINFTLRPELLRKFLNK